MHLTLKVIVCLLKLNSTDSQIAKTLLYIIIILSFVYFFICKTHDNIFTSLPLSICHCFSVYPHLTTFHLHCPYEHLEADHCLLKFFNLISISIYNLIISLSIPNRKFQVGTKKLILDIKKNEENKM